MNNGLLSLILLLLLGLLMVQAEVGICMLQLFDEQVVQHSLWLSQNRISVEFISLEQIWDNVPFDLINKHVSLAYEQYFDCVDDKSFGFAPLVWWHWRRPAGNSNVLHDELLVTEQNEHCWLLLAHLDISRGVFRHPRVMVSPVW